MLLAKHLAEEHVGLVDVIAHQMGPSTALGTMATAVMRSPGDERG
jgi:hypothetical protein